MMNKKIIGILVCMLLILTVVSAMGMTSQKNENEELVLYQSSCVRAPYVSDIVEKTTKPLDIGGTPFYGYVAYDPLYTLDIGPCSFMPISPGAINSLAPTSSTDFLSGGTWVNGVWWGCEYGGYGNPNIWTIDHNNGAMNLVGSYDPGGTGLSFNGLAYDQTTNKLYGCSNTDLYTVSMSTGASTHVGSFGLSGYIMIGIAFDASGNLYGTEVVIDRLYTIDPLTGHTTPVGHLMINIWYGQDMSFDWDNDILYLAAYTLNPNEGALYTCNPDTGRATKVGTFENSAEITCFAIPYSPPNAPIITGPNSGKPGTEYEYTFNAVDPDGDDVRYIIDWGDTIFVKTEYAASGTDVKVSHTWTKKGTFTIKAKAEDTNGLIGPEATKTVTMPRDKPLDFKFNLLGWLFERFPNVFPILRNIIGM